MPEYSYLIYRHYAHLLWENFRGVKSINKHETYTGTYKIDIPEWFKTAHPDIPVPPNAVATLTMRFKAHDTPEEVARHCFLDSSGNRISDQSDGPFNVCVDNWLNAIHSFYEEDYAKYEEHEEHEEHE